MKDPEEETDLYSTPKISIAVFPDNIANEMAAHCSVLLPKATLNVSLVYYWFKML